MGVGPYTRLQYNLNIQPVVPFMLSKNMTLIARTIIPIINQPSFATPPVCATYGCGSTFGLSDIQEQLFFAPKPVTRRTDLGVDPIFPISDRLARRAWSGQVGRRAKHRRLDYARAYRYGDPRIANLVFRRAG